MDRVLGWVHRGKENVRWVFELEEGGFVAILVPSLIKDEIDLLEMLRDGRQLIVAEDRFIEKAKKHGLALDI
jgi:hypothetical protein